MTIICDVQGLKFDVVFKDDASSLCRVFDVGDVLFVEHRNMPVDDAVTLITRSFDKHMLDRRERSEGLGAGAGVGAGVGRAAGPPPSNGQNFLQPSPRIQYLLNLLADHQHLTAAELSLIIEYLVERRRQMDPSGDIPARSGW